MDKRFGSRRRWLAGASALGVSLTSGTGGWHKIVAAEPEAAPATAEQALARLKTGNARFVEGRTRHAHESADWRKHLVGEQKPFATLLCCSDSRVPPELVFDQGFGDLFVVRVAGNVIAADVVGSISYASRHLATPLFVIMGHEGCGAVTAAVDAKDGKAKEPKYIEALVKLIEPGLADLPASLKREPRIAAAVEANVRWSMKQLAEMPEARAALASKTVSLAGAVYDLQTGAVRFL